MALYFFSITTHAKDTVGGIVPKGGDPDIPEKVRCAVILSNVILLSSIPLCVGEGFGRGSSA